MYLFHWYIFYILYTNKMVKKAVSHLHSQTPNKDRLVLVALVAIFAFTVVNTVLQFTEIVIADAVLHVL